MATIAVIDNEEDSRELLQTLLEGEGHSVEQFKSGEDFLRTFKAGLFKLILVDLTMPDMDGYELLQNIQRQDPAVPVIAVTANVYEIDRDRCRAAGFSDFITKPFMDMYEFFNVILKRLNQNSN